MCSESMFCLSVLKILTPHFQVVSWSSPFLSTSKACLHFLAHSYTSVYERLNFKIASQKVAHACVHYFVFTDLVFLREKQQSVLFVTLLFHVFCTMWLCRKISIFILEWFFFVCTFDEYIIKLQVRQKKPIKFDRIRQHLVSLARNRTPTSCQRQVCKKNVLPLYYQGSI